MAAKKKKARRRPKVERGNIPKGKKPKGGSYDPPYGTVWTEPTGNVTTVVRKIFRHHLVDYFHVRVINTANPSLLELVERQHGGLLFSSDEPTLNDALKRAAGFIASHAVETGV